MAVLYGIGVGPGDPELLTLKAARIIRECPVIAVPVAKAGGTSYALSIAEGFLSPEQIVLQLHFPMVRDLATRKQHRAAAADAVAAEIGEGRDVAFLTEGDPLLHSTFIYVLSHLPEDVPITIVPGVSSIAAAAAEARFPLASADQRLAVVSGTSGDEDALRHTLEDFDTVVLLKVRGILDNVLDMLAEHNLLEGAVLVERASHAGGRVIRDVASLRGQSLDYLSLLLVRGKGGAP